MLPSELLHVGLIRVSEIIIESGCKTVIESLIILQLLESVTLSTYIPDSKPEIFWELELNPLTPDQEYVKGAVPLFTEISIDPEASLWQVSVLMVVSIVKGELGSETLILSNIVLQLLKSVTVTVYKPVSKLYIIEESPGSVNPKGPDQEYVNGLAPNVEI